MIPGCRDEISTRPAETDITLRLHVEIKFRPGKAGQFFTWYQIMHAFSLNFSLQACHFTKNTKAWLGKNPFVRWIERNTTTEMICTSTQFFIENDLFDSNIQSKPTLA